MLSLLFFLAFHLVQAVFNYSNAFKYLWRETPKYLYLPSSKPT